MNTVTRYTITHGTETLSSIYKKEIQSYFDDWKVIVAVNRVSKERVFCGKHKTKNFSNMIKIVRLALNIKSASDLHFYTKL